MRLDDFERQQQFCKVFRQGSITGFLEGPWPVILIGCVTVPPGDDDAADLGRCSPVASVHHRRFAAPERADDCGELALANAQNRPATAGWPSPPP